MFIDIISKFITYFFQLTFKKIEQMIRTQLKDFNLNRDQKEFIERSANQALRFNQQLNDLRQKLKQHISGVPGVCKSNEYILN